MDARARAIEELYRSEYRRFRNVLATLTGSHETARDAVQEAFARALSERGKFRGEGSLERWVWKIAIRTALRSRRPSREIPADGSIDPGLVESDRDPELFDALRTLPPRRRLIVFLRYFGDLSYAEIGEVCGIAEGTVAASLAQAHAALEKALAGRASEPTTTKEEA